MQRSTRYLGWIQHAHLDHVAIFTRGSVVAKVAFAFKHFINHDRRLVTSIGSDFTQRLLNGTQHDLDAGVLLVVVAFDGNRSTGTQQCHAAASHDAFFNGSTGCVQRIFNAGFFLFHFYFGCSANFDQRNTTGQLGNTFLQLFLVVVASRFFDLDTHLRHAGLDGVFFASAINDGGVFFSHFNFFGLTHLSQSCFFQRQAHFFGDDCAAGQNSDVFQHGLATIAKAWGFNSNSLQDAANVVHYQRR